MQAERDQIFAELRSLVLSHVPAGSQDQATELLDSAQGYANKAAALISAWPLVAAGIGFAVGCVIGYRWR
jgi:ElaB/YqjD/DUF883 family membrane-anchored ribosome-binding protein